MTTITRETAALCLEIVEDELPRALKLLEQVVNINSFTGNHAGVNAVQDVFEDVFAKLNLETLRIKEETSGDNLIARTSATGPRILLMGHVDTVFPPDSEFRHFSKDDTNVYGPGVLDMKGGLIVIVLALRTLFRLNRLDELPLTVFFNSDEEIGSPQSRNRLPEACHGVSHALVFEGDRPGGFLTTKRKGIADFEVSVTGRAAHAGVRHQDGLNAIAVMAKMITALEDLTDYSRGISANVGKCSGGTAFNVVPEHAQLCVEVRAETAEALADLRREVRSRVVALTPPEAKSSVKELFGLEPLEETPASLALFEAYRKVGELGGYDHRMAEEPSGGGSDANNLAALKIPTLDGLGVVGEHLHTDKEYAEIRSFIVRAHCLVLFLLQGMHEN